MQLNSWHPLPYEFISDYIGVKKTTYCAWSRHKLNVESTFRSDPASIFHENWITNAMSWTDRSQLSTCIIVHFCQNTAMSTAGRPTIWKIWIDRQTSSINPSPACNSRFGLYISYLSITFLSTLSFEFSVYVIATYPVAILSTGKDLL